MSSGLEDAPAAWKKARKRTLLAGAVLLALALGLSLLDVFVDPVRDWAVDHVIATTFGTSAIVVLFGVLVIDARAEQRERERTDGAVLEAKAELYSALVKCACDFARAYADAKRDIKRVGWQSQRKREDERARLSNRVSAARRELTENLGWWRFVEHREELQDLFAYCRNWLGILDGFRVILYDPIPEERRWHLLADGVDWITSPTPSLVERAKAARSEILQRARSKDARRLLERWMQDADRGDDMAAEQIRRMYETGELTGDLDIPEPRGRDDDSWLRRFAQGLRE